MTFAEELANSYTAPQGLYGLAGTTFAIKDLIQPWVGRRTPVGGGELYVPIGCTWKTKQTETGGVQFSFDGKMPVYYTSKAPECFAPEVTMMVLHLGADGLRAEFYGRVMYVPLPSPYPISLSF